MKNTTKIILAVVALLIVFVAIMMIRDLRKDDTRNTQDSEVLETITQEESVGSTDLDASAIQGKLVGSWIEAGQTRGFKLNADGSASSIATPEIDYTAWSVEGKLLILTIGTSGDVADRAAFNIVSVDDNNLALAQGTFVSQYTKSN